MIKSPSRWTIWIVFCLAVIPGRFTSAADSKNIGHIQVGRAMPATNTRVVDVDPPSQRNRFTPLPAGPLFDDLLADPRWPRLSASWLRYHQDDRFKNVGATSLGARIPFFNLDTAPLAGDKKWQFEVQAAAFSIFDMDGKSTDLINTDFQVAAALSWREGDTSAMTRIFHQSSHLGDEFLLANPAVKRMNLILNGVDVIYSLEYLDAYRLYGGTGFLFDTNPDSFDPWHIRYGLEYQSPRSFVAHWIRPIAAVDCQQGDETGWDLSLSLVGGVQLENPQRPIRQMRILLEYFNGNSPDGQFYPDTIEHLGVGLRVHY